MMISRFDQVAPLSSERIAAMLKPRVSCSFFGAADQCEHVEQLTVEPALSGRTTIRLPIVWAMVPALKIFLAGSHEFPPSVVRAR